MAQKIFQSFRKIPGHFPAFRKKPEPVDLQGSRYRISVCSDYGFPLKPTSVAYDPVLDMLAILTRDGNIYIYGKPGISFSAVHETVAQYIQVAFLTGTRKLITLTDSDDIYLWELTSAGQGSNHLIQKSCLRRITSNLRSLPSGVGSPTGEETSHITALCYSLDSHCILLGTDNGWVASVRLNNNAVADDYTKFWSTPSADDAIIPSRILDGISPDRRQRLRADAVVVLLERPGFPGQLLIGYSSGLSLLFDLRSDRIMALLPWQHGLESAAWCGGSGLPYKSNQTSHSPQLGTRLLTAHSDGSLGVWSLKEVSFSATTSSVQAPLLSMEEAPSMPYGPFPCKLISKVFWLPSSLGGITVFVGGMPRATYGERHTVSVLRGSNLDRAANATVVAARIAAAAEAEDDDEIPEESPLSVAPIHVFDSDAPEHVCFDLPSSLIDLIPIGPAGGPVQILILLCEEEMVAIDLITPGWPFMRPPYLTCLHTTSLTSYNLTTQVSPTFLSNLEAAGAYYGPEGRFGRGGAIADNPAGVGWSSLPWPIQGGHALINGSRLSTSSLGGNILYTDDLLLTGHEDGSVAFWRLSAGGCLRRIYTLHTAILFEDVSQLDHTNGVDDDGDAWPPFRQAGVFDPFMDDSRVAIQFIYLSDNTVVVGGAAGQRHSRSFFTIDFLVLISQQVFVSDFKPNTNDAGKNLPLLSVVSEEQIRLFNLPNLHLKYKARITATDGYRIKSASIIGFRTHGKVSSSLSKESNVDSTCGDLDRSIASGVSVTSHKDQNCEYSFVFTNVGGQTVVLSMPQLRRMDTLHLLDSHDVVAVSSVVFSQPGSTHVNAPGHVHGPALGLYQLAPGQLTLFDVIRTGQKASLLGVSYRPIYRLSLTGTTKSDLKNFSDKTNGTGDSGISYRSNSSQNLSDSVLSRYRSDSVRNGLVSPSSVTSANDGITYSIEKQCAI
ncbi:unnamed protein product [Heterobilharzia americana]|nr:unnamed protein product [Heterobilharzia americana]